MELSLRHQQAHVLHAPLENIAERPLHLVRRVLLDPTVDRLPLLALPVLRASIPMPTLAHVPFVLPTALHVPRLQHVLFVPVDSISLAPLVLLLVSVAMLAFI